MSVISRVDEIKETVVYLYSPEASGERADSARPLGTGFFVAIPHHEAQGGAWPYLVTAKHVLKNSEGEYSPEVLARTNLRNWSPTACMHEGSFGKESSMMVLRPGLEH